MGGYPAECAVDVGIGVLVDVGEDAVAVLQLAVGLVGRRREPAQHPCEHIFNITSPHPTQQNRKITELTPTPEKIREI